MTETRRVKTVMTQFPHAVAWEEGVNRAVEMMQEHGIHHLPVMRDDEIHGVVSDADLRVAQALRHARADQADVQVGLLCTRNPYVVDLETPLLELAEQLVERQIGSALVTRAGKLCGILTTTDLAQLLCELLRAETPAEPDDGAG